jgi:hypothetical protein
LRGCSVAASPWSSPAGPPAASSSRTLTGGYAKGKTRPNLQLRGAAKRALKKARSLTVTLAGSVKQSPLATLKLSKALTFKR